MIWAFVLTRVLTKSKYRIVLKRNKSASGFSTKSKIDSLKHSWFQANRKTEFQLRENYSTYITFNYDFYLF